MSEERLSYWHKFKALSWEKKVLYGVLAFVALNIFIGLFIPAPPQATAPTASKPPSEAPKENKVVADDEQKGWVVQNSPWDGSVRQVEQYLDKNLNDPKSFEAIEWSSVRKFPDGNYVVRCKYRAKNSFGGYGIANQLFKLDKDGAVIGAVDYR